MAVITLTAIESSGVGGISSVELNVIDTREELEVLFNQHPSQPYFTVNIPEEKKTTIFKHQIIKITD
jgi:hypothetical protein